MVAVEKNLKNMMKCICLKKCPSYTFACKIKSMPENALSMIKGDMSKLSHLEGFYCAYDKSNCLTEEKGCVCAKCGIYKEYNLDKQYYCTVNGGK